MHTTTLRWRALRASTPVSRLPIVQDRGIARRVARSTASEAGRRATS